MSFKKMMPLVMLVGIMILGAAFLPLILGSIEEGQSTNLSQEYKDQLNSTKDVNIVSVSVVRWISPILGVVILMVALMYFAGKKKNRF